MALTRDQTSKYLMISFGGATPSLPAACSCFCFKRNDSQLLSDRRQASWLIGFPATGLTMEMGFDSEVADLLKTVGGAMGLQSCHQQFFVSHNVLTLWWGDCAGLHNMPAKWYAEVKDVLWPGLKESSSAPSAP